ncbi:SDR family NAD(P)-dependent oxidoreductase [Paenibacillus hamazuiensis]|uniref:SDR family NAD(P)-dependent oxidoreductase n=1 Tax=Paenibacillus hamazuiensis TaxID=2936508 RepID=UPI00200F794C|nr:SDR family NAD(P)-dependent oxidoreductase [Paenibacillus hamazuiensis]
MGEELKGRAAVITGAGRGIGRAIALAYAEAGASVCCVARTRSEIDETAAMIAARGGQALAIAADVCELSAMESVFAAATEAFGGLDIVVVNAGANLTGDPVEESDPAAWERTVQVNLIGSYYTVKSAIPHLKARGAGKIITIGSGLGYRGNVGDSAYSCSKAGLWMLTRVLAQELKPFNISVNELIPGPVVTEMSGIVNRPDEGTPKGRFAAIGEWIKEPQDVAPLALFLASQPDIGPTAQSFSLMRRDR